MYWQWLSRKADITTSPHAHRDAIIARLWRTDHVLLAVFTRESVGRKWEYDDGTLGKSEAMHHLRRELNT